MTERTEQGTGLRNGFRVLIFGYFGVGNLGDEAVVDVVIEAIRRRHPEARIEAVCLDPSAVTRDHGIGGFPIRRMASTAHPAATADLPWGRRLLRRISRIAPSEVLFLAQAYRWLKGTDLVVVGGSGQLIDDEGGPLNHPYNHWKWVVMARLVGARFAFLSVGAGPIHTRMGRWFIRRALEAADYISFRDEFSLTLARSLGVRRSMELVPDQAFGIAEREKTPYPGEAQGPFLTVGVAPMAYCDPRHWSEHDPARYMRYVEEMSLITLHLLQSGMHVLFFHTQVDGDDRVIPDILERVRPQLDEHRHAMITEHRVGSSRDALDAIRRTNVVVASRFHAVLFSLVLRRPVVAISYHQKVTDLMKAFECGEFEVSIDTFNAGSVLGMVRRISEGGGTYTAAVEEKLDRYRAMIEVQYDHVLGHLVARRSGSENR